MKKIYLLYILISVSCFAFSQTRREERVKEIKKQGAFNLFDLDIDDLDFVYYQIPENYKKEPAIILCQSTKYICEATSEFSPYISRMHRKVVIIEKAALEDFSTLYFDLDLIKGKDKIAIKLIKPDGKQNVITGMDAIKVEKGNIPSVYRSAFGGGDIEYYKMAIPNLEVGDTLEYFLEKNSLLSNVSLLGVSNFGKLYYYLNKRYPIIKQKIEFQLSKTLSLTCKSVFGAPEIKPIELERRGMHGFLFIDSFRAQIEDERWLAEARELPHIKFSILHYKDKVHNFVSDEVEIAKSSVTLSEMKDRFANTIQYGKLNKFLIATELGLMKKNFREIDNEDTLVELIYNHIRSISRGSFYSLNDEAFTGLFYEALQKYGIKADLIAVPNRFLSDNKNLVFSSELIFCLKYKDKFIYPGQSNSNVFEKDKAFDGQTGFIAIMDKKGARVDEVKEIILPTSTYSENFETNYYDVRIPEDNFDHIKIIDTCYYGGMIKRNYNSFLTKLMELNVKDDNKFLFMKDEKDEKGYGNKSRIEEEKNKKKETKKSEYEEFITELKERYSNSYSKVISIDTFIHLQTGTRPGKPILSDKTEFTLADLTKKVGDKYLVELGKIIGFQAEVSKDERVRLNNIWLDFPKELNNTIRFKIPDGYIAEGLENFNFNVDNEAGKFSSKALLENGYVIITTQKIYKLGFMPKEQWPNLVNMLDAAFNFTQKKMILRK